VVRAKQSTELSGLSLSDTECTGHLPKLVEGLAIRLSQTSPATGVRCQRFPLCRSPRRTALSAGLHASHACARIANTPGDSIWDAASNLNQLDFSLQLPDVMTIADEVDPQLTQSMDSYMKVMWKSAA
jgi:hypothetical protein